MAAELVNRTKAAEQLGIDRTWLWKLENDGRVPVPRRRKIDGRAVYTPGDIARLRRKLTALTR